MFSGSAWRVVKFGDPHEAIELQTMTWNEPPPGQVLIRVAAAGVGYPDRLMTSGNYPLVGLPPFGLGQEAAGEVVAVGEGSIFAVGDTIAGATAFQEGWGGYAEYTYVRENQAIRSPKVMTSSQAAGFPVGFRTAHAGLVERGRLEAGQTVLVLGAAGSTGSAAVQLAKALGMTVIAVAGGAQKTQFSSEHGADQVIDYRSEDVVSRISELTGGRGVDAIYDTVGGELATTALAGLARNGCLLLVGQASGAGPTVDPTALMIANTAVAGVLALPHEDRATEFAVWYQLESLVNQGKITTPVGSLYGFEDVPKMVAEQGSAAPGKSIVVVRETDYHGM